MEELYTLFESYLDGTMSEAEKKAFALRLGQEPDLQTAFTEYQQIRSGYQQRWKQAPAQQQLKATLEEVGADYFRPDKKPRRLRWLWVVAAAAAAVLLILLWPSNDNFYEKHYQTPGPVALVQKSNDLQQWAQQAERAFNNQRL